jgi:hypothetical protein
VPTAIDPALLSRLDQSLYALASADGLDPADLQWAPAAYFRPLRHELSDHYVARHRPDFRLRTPIERAALDKIGADRLHQAMRSMRDFRDYFLRIAQFAAPGVEYRRTRSWLAPDAAGVSIELPAADNALATLDELRRFLQGGTGSLGLSAVTALLLTVNAHALTDGNGRTARILFNAVLRSRFPTMAYLPLSEVFQRSDGGYEIALRQAEIRGEWEPLLQFVTSVALFCRERTQVHAHA